MIPEPKIDVLHNGKKNPFQHRLAYAPGRNDTPRHQEHQFSFDKAKQFAQPTMFKGGRDFGQLLEILNASVFRNYLLPLGANF
jgi:hypothetical protein